MHRGTLSAAPKEQEVESRFSPSSSAQWPIRPWAGEDVLAFWFGESDQPTPSFIREAAIASLRDGETFYSENLGRPYLRQAIATYLTDLHHLPIGTDRIAVTASGVSALMLASQLLVAPGDRVVTVTPLWPNAVEIPKVVSGRVTCVSLEVQDGRWTLPLEKLLHALTPGTRMLVLNSPNNPTGWTIQRAEQVAILEHCRRHGIWIIADDVYERLVYRRWNEIGSVVPHPGRRRRAVDRGQQLLQGLEHDRVAFGLDGRAACHPADLASLLEYNTSCVSEFTQRAGAIALQQGEPYVVKLRAELANTKEKLFAALRPLPRLEVPEADGAMYLFLRVAGEDDSVRLAKRLIEEVGLGLAPGRAFGPEGEGWLRWCYAADWKKIESGIERLARFLSNILSNAGRFPRREPLHTIKVLALGFVLLGAFLLIGRALGHGSRAALYFLPVWLAGAAINLWFGVAKAGYSMRDEAPIFLLIFAIPSALALLASVEACLGWRPVAVFEGISGDPGGRLRLSDAHADGLEGNDADHLSSRCSCFCLLQRQVLVNKGDRHTTLTDST